MYVLNKYTHTKVGDKMENRIKEVRRSLGYTQKEVSEKLGLSRTQYIKHEQGKTRMPVDIIVRLSKLFNVSTDYLLNLKNTK